LSATAKNQRLSQRLNNGIRILPSGEPPLGKRHFTLTVKPNPAASGTFINHGYFCRIEL
jgi:hypothetical protein